MAKASMTVNAQLCKGCRLCISVCPKKLLELDDALVNDKGYHVMHCTDEEACILCANCALICPDTAITLENLE